MWAGQEVSTGQPTLFEPMETWSDLEGSVQCTSPLSSL